MLREIFHGQKGHMRITAGLAASNVNNSIYTIASGRHKESEENIFSLKLCGAIKYKQALVDMKVNI
jgi:hypothetical protein